MAGELRGGKVWVQDQAEANRIYNKGRFGRPRSGGSLELDLVEAAYLMEKGRLSLRDADTPEEFYREAGRLQPEFIVRSIAYRELREKSIGVQLAHGDALEAGFHYVLPDPKGNGGTAKTYVMAASERAPILARDLVRLASRCRSDSREGLVIVVDEESDTTTYEIGFEDPRGSTPGGGPVQADASFQSDRAIVWDPLAAKRLHQKEFFGRPFTKGLHLSLVEVLHLARRGLRFLDAREGKPLGESHLLRAARKIEPGIEARWRIYEDLKDRQLVVKTGYKFGTHFRAYLADPEGSHAPFLVHAIASDDALEWPVVSRAVRLAHGVRKTLLFAVPTAESVQYVRLRRSK